MFVSGTVSIRPASTSIPGLVACIDLKSLTSAPSEQPMPAP
jgi:hypothetical protein